MADTNGKCTQFGEEEGGKEEEEYVLLELDDCLYSDIEPNAPYVLSVSWSSIFLISGLMVRMGTL
jgi:general transcription factor 3C polypeptide 6